MRIGVVWMEQYQDRGGDISESMKGGGGGGGGSSGEAWGTWEELLLACAVKRHGVEDWESVAMEVQGKTSLPQLLTTAFNCKLKYHDLQRRFHHAHADDPDPIPWLHHLKNLRLAQLRQDLHRYDVSIMSLQSKVKRLEEEGKHDDDPKPDPEEHNSKRRSRSEDKQNDKNTPDEPARSKNENQSVNGSNSTCSKTQEDHPNNNNNKKSSTPVEPDQLPPGSAQPSKVGLQLDSDSDKGSCENQERESGSSEAQSSASLTRQQRRLLELQDQPNQQVSEKSQPLAAVLQMIRAHQHGSLFERRLTSQESDEYKSIIQQHVDLETIEAKLQKQRDLSCTLQFYRDLLLLFTNAVVFFPKSSIESVTAHQLRRLVLNEMKKRNLITRPDPCSEPSDSLPSQSHTTVPTPLPKHQLERSDSLLAKHKTTTPIIVCRKRSSISSKPCTVARKASTAADHQEAEALAASDIKPLNNSKASNAEAAATKANEKPVTGTRSSRRTTATHNESNARASSTKRKSSSPAETPKSGKKRKTPEEQDKKIGGGAAAAADFLKRLKRNSPARQKLKVKTSGSGTSRGAEQKKRPDKVKERNKKQVKEESSPSKRSVGRPSKKAAETSSTLLSPKRSRDKQQQQASKLPKKRSRR